MRKNNMLDALLPRTRQNILATLLLSPERRWYLSDLAQHLKVTPKLQSSLEKGGPQPISWNSSGTIRSSPTGPNFDRQY